MDSTNNIVRPSSGKKFYWKDICAQETYTKTKSNGTSETISRVSISSLNLI